MDGTGYIGETGWWWSLVCTSLTRWCWFFILPSRWNNILQIDMSLHSTHFSDSWPTSLCSYSFPTGTQRWNDTEMLKWHWNNVTTLYYMCFNVEMTLCTCWVKTACLEERQQIPIQFHCLSMVEPATVDQTQDIPQSRRTQITDAFFLLFKSWNIYIYTVKPALVTTSIKQ